MVERKTKRVSGIQTKRQRESGASLHSIEREMKWQRPTSLTAQKIRILSVWWKSYNICSPGCRNRYPHCINAWGHSNQECRNTPGHISSRAILQPEPHTSQAGLKRRCQTYHWYILFDPPYNPKLAPSYYYLFGSLKQRLGDRGFHNTNKVEIVDR